MKWWVGFLVVALLGVALSLSSSRHESGDCGFNFKDPYIGKVETVYHLSFNSLRVPVCSARIRFKNRGMLGVISDEPLKVGDDVVVTYGRHPRLHDPVWQAVKPKSSPSLFPNLIPVLF